MHGDRVEGEVACCEIGVDPLADRREVNRFVDAVDDDPPGAVSLREREHRATEAAREPMCGIARIRTGHIEIENRPQKKLVANGTADDPCVLVREDLAEPLIHRS